MSVHCVFAPGSVVKLHVGEETFDGVAGDDVIVTFGGVVSSAYVSPAGEPTFPTVSIARTWNV